MCRMTSREAALRPCTALQRVIGALELAPMTTDELAQRLNLSRRSIEDSLYYLRNLAAARPVCRVTLPNRHRAALWQLQQPVGIAPNGGPHV